MTTNQTIDGVPRELLVRLCNFHATGWEDIEPEIKELRALLDAPAAVSDGVNWKAVANEQMGIIQALKAAQPQGEPIYQLEYLGEGGGGWNDVDKKTYDNSAPIKSYRGRIVYAEQPAPVSSTSDKYKAELYDEVWQKARDMGFGNVTDALMKLEKQPAPVAVVLPERKRIRAENSVARVWHSQGWNLCLDEVARLNAGTNP